VRVARLLPLGQFVGMTGVRSTVHCPAEASALMWPVLGGNRANIMALFSVVLCR
jgi:hypothetical protein